MIKANPSGPGWYWAEEDGEPATVRSVVFSADTDPVPLKAEHESTGGWVRVAAGRTKVVKADGSGWKWVEVDG